MPNALALSDAHLAQASNTIERALADVGRRPGIEAFFDQDTFTVSYVVYDPERRAAAIIDSVLDYEPNSGRTSTKSAQRIIQFIEANNLTVQWILESHAHADHLSAAPYLQERLGGKLAIGEHIVTVQQVFGKLFNAGTEFQRDGSDFDRLWKDGDRFAIGTLDVTVLQVP